MRERHRDLWDMWGPFELSDFRADPSGVFKDFMTIVALADRDETLVARDKTFIRWTQAAREIRKLMPSGPKEYLVYSLLFVCFVLLLTHAIMGVFR
ncbi:MAG: hypothetical protein GC185_05520 [Alphaproteobacteria bacterium]|nr:hypothetical protein [Alphaproteobacteria bacterium]